MVVAKLSVALDEDVAREATEAAREAGVSMSAWLNAAAGNALAIRRGLRAMNEWEVENGAFTADELNRADAVLGRLLGTDNL